MLKAYRIILMFALFMKYCHITLMSEIFKKIPRGIRASLKRKFASHLKRSFVRSVGLQALRR